MTSFCRLCAEEKEPSEIITTINDSSRLVEQKLIACCQWDPQTTEYKLPQDVCVVCLDKLEKSWLFSQSVKQAQRNIHDLFETRLKSTRKSSKTPFECPVCFTTFLSRLAMERHDCSSTPRVPQCHLCNKTFKSNEALQSHCRKQEKHKCGDCAQAFCTERALVDHKHQKCCGIVEMVPIDEILIDETQSKPTFVDCYSVMETDKEMLEIEVKKEPDEESEIETGLERPASIPTPNAEPLMNYDSVPMQAQIDVDVDIRPGTSQPDKSSSECNADDKQYECHLCKKSFTLLPSIRNHMVLHTMPRKYKCEYCNCVFRKERFYTSHLKKHIDYYCETCHKKFTSAFALKVHKRMHVGISRKMFGCKECDHYFIDVSTFYNHMKRRHGLDSATAKQKAILIEPNGTAKPYVCEECGKDFFDRSSLVAHSVVHVDIRPFKCDLCEKTFKNKYALKAHRETHTGEKSVQCTECGKKYSCKSALIKHMGEHTGQFFRTYPCDFCDRIFYNSYNMNNHRRTHTGEKPFKCEVCNIATTTKSQLKRHLITISHISKANETMSFGHSTG